MTEALPLVLVVEDEPLQRMMAVDLVEDAGCAALEAASAAQAIALLETRPEIRVVFTDIDLPPGHDGMWLADCVRRRWPPVGLLVTSGHVAARDVVLPPGSRFFAKPYRRAEVLQALRGLAGAA